LTGLNEIDLETGKGTQIENKENFKQKKRLFTGKQPLFVCIVV
jgi:hypothetical protein